MKFINLFDIIIQRDSEVQYDSTWPDAGRTVSVHDISVSVSCALLMCNPLLPQALVEPGRWSCGDCGHKWGTKWPSGLQQRLPVCGPATPESGPDESQCDQWNNEHRKTLHQAPQGHMWGNQTAII